MAVEAPPAVAEPVVTAARPAPRPGEVRGAAAGRVGVGACSATAIRSPPR